jgi:hypothetical protein
MGASCVKNTETLICKIPTLHISVNILCDTFEINKSYLKFICYSLDSGYLTVRFFVYEQGISYIQDSTNPLPNQEYTLSPNCKNKIIVRLNQAYIESFVYEPFLPWPVVIEAKVGDSLQVVFVEIREGLPYVVEKRVCVAGNLFRFSKIKNITQSDQPDYMKICMVCFENKRNVLGLPCNDLVFCVQCAQKERSKVNPRCPACNECKE